MTQTDTQTDHATPSLAIGSMFCMRCGLMKGLWREKIDKSLSVDGARSRTVCARRRVAAVSRYVTSSAWSTRRRRQMTLNSRCPSSTTSWSFQTSAATRRRRRHEPISATLHRVRRLGPSTAGRRSAQINKLIVNKHKIVTPEVVTRQNAVGDSRLRPGAAT